MTQEVKIVVHKIHKIPREIPPPTNLTLNITKRDPQTKMNQKNILLPQTPWPPNNTTTKIMQPLIVC